MAYQELSFPLIAPSTALLVQLAAGVEPLLHVCTIDEKFEANSEYDKNLRILLRDLYYRTPATGYQYESVTVTGKNNDTVYGSALCRGDVSQADCRACVSEATKGIGQICPNNVGANVYYEHCSLEYSNSNSFGDPISTGYYLRSNYNASIPTSHSSLADIKKLFNVLSDQASASKKLYATGVTKLEDSVLNAYGLVQCHLDLTPADCSTCIGRWINDLFSVFDGKVGQIFSTTCNLRYEFFPFFNA